MSYLDNLYTPPSASNGDTLNEGKVTDWIKNNKGKIAAGIGTLGGLGTLAYLKSKNKDKIQKPSRTQTDWKENLRQNINGLTADLDKNPPTWSGIKHALH